MPNYYFNHLLFKKNIRNYLDYIGSKKLIRIKQTVFERNAILEDKILFQTFIQENSIPGPVYLGQVKNQVISGISASGKVTSSQALVEVLQELLKQCTVSNSLFIKPLSGLGGAGTYKITLQSLENNALVNKLFHDFQKNNFIIQETVVQHEIMNQLNSSSLNTVRIISYKNANGQVGIASTLSRMGRGGAHVDNASCGGIFVPITLATGQLDKYGYNFIGNGGGTYTAHPDTGLIFEGFKMPYFQESLELVCKAASFFKNKIIGWDVAVTVNGPILIEGNYNPHLIGTQTACGGFRGHAVYQDLFKDYL